MYKVHVLSRSDDPANAALRQKNLYVGVSDTAPVPGTAVPLNNYTLCGKILGTLSFVKGDQTLRIIPLCTG